jgi:hypothetical protein
MQSLYALGGRRHRFAAILAVLLCQTLTGCAGRLAGVSGIVRYDGKPLSHGTIQFLGTDGIARAGTIQPDGSFSVQVPVGVAKVIVTCFDEAQMKHVSAALAGKQGRVTPPSPAGHCFTKIPQCYADWDASGLAISVEGDETVHDVVLTSKCL